MSVDVPVSTMSQLSSKMLKCENLFEEIAKERERSASLMLEQSRLLNNPLECKNADKINVGPIYQELYRENKELKDQLRQLTCSHQQILEQLKLIGQNVSEDKSVRSMSINGGFNEEESAKKPIEASFSIKSPINCDLETKYKIMKKRLLMANLRILALTTQKP